MTARACIFVACLVWSLSALGSGGLADVMSTFGQRCEGAAFNEDHPDAIFTDGNYTREWRATNLNELAECEKCYDTALVWRSKTATIVGLEQSSETQDWQRRMMYCYDANGRATSALLVFTSVEGWALVGYYSVRHGAFVLTTTTFRNLKTWAAIPEPGSWSAYRNAHGTPEPYATIGRLPFAPLLRHPDKQQ
jgi:hypothetical protein